MFQRYDEKRVMLKSVNARTARIESASVKGDWKEDITMKRMLKLRALKKSKMKASSSKMYHFSYKTKRLSKKSLMSIK